jgi:predicted NAD/FAD-dependent oxidoreductase
MKRYLWGVLFFISNVVWHECVSHEDIDGKRTVIIGAGIGGLTVHQALRESGISSDVYEAQGRPGGRIWTHTFLDGKRSEVGATFVCAGDEAVLALCHKLGVELRSLEDIRLRVIGEDGNLLDREAFQDMYSYINIVFNGDIPSIERQDKNLGNLIKRVLGNDQKGSNAYGIIRLVFADLYGLDMKDLPAKSVELIWPELAKVALSSFDKIGENYVMRDGTSALLDPLTRDTNIYYNYILQAMSINEKNQYVMTFENGENVVGDQVILALPLPVLEMIRFPDHLAELKRRLTAISSKVPYGMLQRDVLPNSDAEYYYEINLNKGWIAWPGGIGTKTIVRLNSDEERLPESLLNHDWGYSRFSHGAYPSAFEYDAVQELFTQAKDIPGLFFVGDYLSPNPKFIGYMEGAVRSAQHVAQRLIELSRPEVQ